MLPPIGKRRQHDTEESTWKADNPNRYSKFGRSEGQLVFAFAPDRDDIKGEHTKRTKRTICIPYFSLSLSLSNFKL
jgi:hypothetical protein